MVLFATGNTGVAAQQSGSFKRKTRKIASEDSVEEEESADIEASEEATSDAIETKKTSEDIEAKEPEEEDADPHWKTLPSQPTTEEPDEDDLDLPASRARTGPPEPLNPAIIKSRRSTLKELYDLTRETETTQLPSAKQKQELRAIRKRMRPLVARPWRMAEEDIDAVAGELETLIVAIEERTRASRAPEEEDDLPELHEATGKRPFFNKSKEEKKAPRENEHLKALAQVEGEWEPKDYMAPFAFVPRYLEVNHTVCSAVYLRHPVARMGLAEVPSPFPLETGNLAFAYYLRRR
jgi:hypothetical protein